MSLNEKQLRFCEEYIVDFNATQAAIRAGYSDKSAYSQAHDLLKKHEVQERIAELKKNLAKNTEITFDWKVNKLNEILQRAMNNIYDKHGNERPTDIKAAISAINELNKMQGHHSEEKLRITSIKSHEEVMQELDKMDNEANAT